MPGRPESPEVSLESPELEWQETVRPCNNMQLFALKAQPTPIQGTDKLITRESVMHGSALPPSHSAGSEGD